MNKARKVDDVIDMMTDKVLYDDADLQTFLQGLSVAMREGIGPCYMDAFFDAYEICKGEDGKSDLVLATMSAMMLTHLIGPDSTPENDSGIPVLPDFDGDDNSGGVYCEV